MTETLFYRKRERKSERYRDTEIQRYRGTDRQGDSSRDDDRVLSAALYEFTIFLNLFAKSSINRNRTIK